MEITISGRRFIVTPLIILFFPLLLFCGIYTRRTKVRFGRKLINAYIADNILSHAIGYMFRHPQDIAKDEGILFVFPSERSVSFWMLDVFFPVNVYALDEKNNPLGSALMKPHTLAQHELKGRRFLELPLINKI